MKKIDLKAKLTSRKFWIAVAGLVCSACVLFGVDELTIEKLTALVSALGVLATYILTEGYIDSKRIKKDEGESK